MYSICTLFFSNFFKYALFNLIYKLINYFLHPLKKERAHILILGILLPVKREFKINKIWLANTNLSQTPPPPTIENLVFIY